MHGLMGTHDFSFLDMESEMEIQKVYDTFLLILERKYVIQT